MTHTSLTLRRRAAVAVAVVLGAVGLGVPGLGLRPAVAQAECDAQCWAILYYLTEQGLTPEEIEELGTSGIPPDPDTAEEFFQPPTVATTTLPPAPTTTATTTTATTTTRPNTPAPTTTLPAYNGECDPTASWACDEINAGIDDGYLPEGFNPHDAVDTQDLLLVIEDFGNENPNFDEQAALLALQSAGAQTNRGEMFNVIAAGLGIPYNPDDPFEVADELADLGILLGPRPRRRRDRQPLHQTGRRPGRRPLERRAGGVVGPHRGPHRVRRREPHRGRHHWRRRAGALCDW